LPLDLANEGFAAKVSAAKGTTVGDIEFDGFQNQKDVVLNTRLAADIAGATPMDRPEWGAVDPRTGEVYFTLTTTLAVPKNKPMRLTRLRRTGTVISFAGRK